MGIQRLVSGFLIGSLSLAAQATSLPRYGTFVYSSLCLDRDNTGDLNGDRLIIIRLPLHDLGYLEWSDGSLSSVPLQDLKIDDKNGKISFRYVRDHDDLTGKSNVLKSVSSTITAESVGLISWDGKPFQIMRSRSLGQALPNCSNK